eukprot:scaffold108783_cov84-Phaeocystis_antarctica.AAC.3
MFVAIVLRESLGRRPRAGPFAIGAEEKRRGHSRLGDCPEQVGELLGAVGASAASEGTFDHAEVLRTAVAIGPRRLDGIPRADL